MPTTGVPQSIIVKPPKVTIKHMLACQPEGPCPECAKMYRCPICHDMIGRKALVSPLQKSHDVVKPDGFPFDPRIDVHPGHLACKHCHAMFTMNLAFKTHFQRALYPVLLCNWARDQRFGDLTISETQPPFASEPTSMHPAPFGNCGPNSAYSIPSFLGIPLSKLLMELIFVPEECLTWFHRSIRWLSHHPDIPTSRLPQDTIFHFIAHLQDAPDRLAFN